LVRRSVPEGAKVRLRHTFEQEDSIGISSFTTFASAASSVEALVATIIGGTSCNRDGRAKGSQAGLA